eukprot:7961577-Pyramimonas_sp.AAC.1
MAGGQVAALDAGRSGRDGSPFGDGEAEPRKRQNLNQQQLDEDAHDATQLTSIFWNITVRAKRTPSGCARGPEEGLDGANERAAPLYFAAIQTHQSRLEAPPLFGRANVRVER